MSFGEWQALSPSRAAEEFLGRVQTRLAPEQRRAVLAVVRDRGELERSFETSPRGPLWRVPFLVKDLFDVPGMPTRGGSSFLQEVRPVPPGPSRVVSDAGVAGAVLAGKTHLFEFAWGLTGENAHFGDCERPGSPGLTSGGSSSGSAAAVAAGIVPFAIGTDTGGSVRLPAAFCGVYGYRDIPGTPQIADAVALSPSFDTVGWFASNAADLLTATRALVGAPAPEREPRGAYLEMPGLDEDVARACREAAARLAQPLEERRAAELRERFLPAPEIYGVLAGGEAWRTHRRWAERQRARYGPLVQERIDAARGVSPAQGAAVAPVQSALLRAWSEYFQDHDFLVMAAAPCAALPKAALTAANRLRILSLTGPASLAGLPAVAIPVPLPSGLTAGLQVVFARSASPAVAWVLGR